MKIRNTILGFIILTFLVPQLQAIQIDSGISFNEAKEAMRKAGYKETMLAMEAIDRNNRLTMWTVGEGVLIVTYSIKTKKVVGISYWLSDERPKATRKTFDIEVKSFDTDKGIMMVQTKKPTREQGGADQPATAPELKVEGKEKTKPESEGRSK